MKLTDRGEISLLKRIRERFQTRSRDLVAGIGDDSAVIVPGRQNLLLTTDMMVEGVHFDLEYASYFHLGFKIVSVNASDIYAMGGAPRFLLLDIAAPGRTDERSLESFFDGVQKAMTLYHMKLIGGDVSASRSLVISGTVFGYAKKPIMRSGARPGDRVYVTGHLGDSACGLALLRRIRRPIALERGDRTNRPLSWSTMEPLLRRHLLPEARNPGRITGLATAMIDISDGLLIDLWRLCEESGVGARVHVGQVPLSSQLKKAASFLGLEPDVLAMTGGEDYELLFTAPPTRRVKAFCVGEITDSEGSIVERDGSVKTFSAEGYRHWR